MLSSVYNVCMSIIWWIRGNAPRTSFETNNWWSHYIGGIFTFFYIWEKRSKWIFIVIKQKFFIHSFIRNPKILLIFDISFCASYNFIYSLTFVVLKSSKSKSNIIIFHFSWGAYKKILKKKYVGI